MQSIWAEVRSNTLFLLGRHIMIIQRTNTILYCRKWAETLAFYRDLFQFEISHQSDWFIEFQIAPNAYLSIANENRATIKSANGQGITLAWQVDDIEGVHHFWSEQAVSITEIKKRWGAFVFYLHDPEGHRIELWQKIGED